MEGSRSRWVDSSGKVRGVHEGVVDSSLLYFPENWSRVASSVPRVGGSVADSETPRRIVCLLHVYNTPSTCVFIHEQHPRLCRLLCIFKTTVEINLSMATPPAGSPGNDVHHEATVERESPNWGRLRSSTSSKATDQTPANLRVCRLQRSKNAVFRRIRFCESSSSTLCWPFVGPA